jgi:hypothetical protein
VQATVKEEEDNKINKTKEKEEKRKCKRKGE